MLIKYTVMQSTGVCLRHYNIIVIVVILGSAMHSESGQSTMQRVCNTQMEKELCP